MPISNVLMSPQMQAAYQGMFGNTGAVQQTQKKVAGRIAGITAPPQRTGSPPPQSQPAPHPYLPSSVYPYANQDANMLSSIYNTRSEADFNRDARALQTEAQVSRENSRFKQGIDQGNLTYETNEKLRAQGESQKLDRQNNASDINQQNSRFMGQAGLVLAGADKDQQAQRTSAESNLTNAQAEAIRRANNTVTSTTQGPGDSGNSGTNGYGAYDGVNQNLATLGRLALESRVADQNYSLGKMGIDVNQQDASTRRLSTILQGAQSGVRSYWG
jgi:hypothetical protein